MQKMDHYPVLQSFHFDEKYAMQRIFKILHFCAVDLRVQSFKK